MEQKLITFGIATTKINNNRYQIIIKNENTIVTRQNGCLNTTVHNTL